MTYESTCPRCGAILTAGGCMSCGYPSLRLDAKVGADTAGGGTEFVKFPVLMSALELNATLTARLEEMKATYETSHASRMHAEDCVRRLEKVAELALSLANEFEIAVASREPVRGMRVSPSSDFLACAQLPSAVKRMAWWAREIRKAYANCHKEAA